MVEIHLREGRRSYVAASAWLRITLSGNWLVIGSFQNFNDASI
jgi:hypothetical protein